MKGRWLLTLLAALATSALTARLGVWQLDRAAQKTALQSALNQQRQRPALGPSELPQTAAQAAQEEHRSVALQGRWLPQHTVYLDNRPMNGRTGFFAVTPLQLQSGAVLLVQRGWLPRDMQDRSRIQAAPLPEGTVALLGRVALTPSRLYEFEHAASGAIRQNLNLAEFAQETQLPLLPFVVVQEAQAPSASATASATATAVNDGLLRDWAAPSTGVEKHHGYAFQWFALSALCLSLWCWFELQRRRKNRSNLCSLTPTRTDEQT